MTCEAPPHLWELWDEIFRRADSSPSPHALVLVFDGLQVIEWLTDWLTVLVCWFFQGSNWFQPPRLNFKKARFEPVKFTFESAKSYANVFCLLVCNYLKMQSIERTFALNLSNKWGLNNSSLCWNHFLKKHLCWKKNNPFSLHDIFCLHQILKLKILHKRFRDVTSFFFFFFLSLGVF